MVPEDNFGPRLGADIGFGFLYSGVLAGISFLMFVPGFGGTDYCEWDCQRSRDRLDTTGVIMGGLIGTIAPSLAVHTAHAVWGGEGDIGMTYLGGLLGGLAGMGLGALTLIQYDVKKNPLIPWATMTILGFAGGMAGAIIAYEVTNTRNREQKYGTISRVYPVIELSAERQILGVGMEF